MPYEVRLAPQVARVLRKTRDRDLVQRLVSAIGELAAAPRPAGCRKLEGQDDLWRIRVGDYRSFGRARAAVAFPLEKTTADRRALVMSYSRSGILAAHVKARVRYVPDRELHVAR